MNKVLARRVIVGFQILALSMALLYGFSGQHPPAEAQSPIRYDLVPATTVADEHRDDLLVRHDEEIAALSVRVQKQWDLDNANALAIAAMQAEERIISGILALLIGGSITLQVRAGKRS